MGSGEFVRVNFYTNYGGSAVGGAQIMFSSPLRYNIIECSDSSTWYNFPESSQIPTEVDKVWKITLSVADEGARILYHCNDVEVLNVLASTSACQDGNWNSFWNSNMNVGVLQFDAADKASDFYSFKPALSHGNILLLILQIAP